VVHTEYARKLILYKLGMGKSKLNIVGKKSPLNQLWNFSKRQKNKNKTLWKCVKGIHGNNLFVLFYLDNHFWFLFNAYCLFLTTFLLLYISHNIQKSSLKCSKVMQISLSFIVKILRHFKCVKTIGYMLSINNTVYGKKSVIPYCRHNQKWPDRKLIFYINLSNLLLLCATNSKERHKCIYFYFMKYD